MFRVLALGDVMGRPGRQLIRDSLREIVKEKAINLVIANGENASGGAGLVAKNASELFDAGIDVITSGNHIWHQKGYEEVFEQFPRVIRPANYPEPCPGQGFVIFKKSGAYVAVLNLEGRVFMEPLESPFRTFDIFHADFVKKGMIVLVDFHAEVTSEKVAMGWYVDGRASFLFGTHTHIPTADARILPGGTAYITDIGMCGSMNSVIGMRKDEIIQRFLTIRPQRFDVAEEDVRLNGAICDIDEKTCGAVSIERFEFPNP
jgi:metallophosphoesterase (TIGR00282 family)